MSKIINQKNLTIVSSKEQGSKVSINLGQSLLFWARKKYETRMGN